MTISQLKTSTIDSLCSTAVTPLIKIIHYVRVSTDSIRVSGDSARPYRNIQNCQPLHSNWTLFSQPSWASSWMAILRHQTFCISVGTFNSILRLESLMFLTWDLFSLRYRPSCFTYWYCQETAPENKYHSFAEDTQLLLLLLLLSIKLI